MFDTRYRMLGAGVWGWSREMIWGGRGEGGSGLGTHVHLWLIHVNVWQNQHSIVKQNKVKIKIKKKYQPRFLSLRVGELKHMLSTGSQTSTVWSSSTYHNGNVLENEGFIELFLQSPSRVSWDCLSNKLIVRKSFCPKLCPTVQMQKSRVEWSW